MAVSLACVLSILCMTIKMKELILSADKYSHINSLQFETVYAKYLMIEVSELAQHQQPCVPHLYLTSECVPVCITL